jgi:hypothetical protein
MDEIRRAFTASLHAAQAAGDLIEITLKNGAVHQLHPPIVVGESDIAFSSGDVPANRINVKWNEVAAVGKVKNLTF